MHFLLTSDIAKVIIIGMGYETKLQVIERKNRTRQFYIICPAPLAEALEMQKGETLEFVVEDKRTLTIKRVQASRGKQ